MGLDGGGALCLVDCTEIVLIGGVELDAVKSVTFPWVAVPYICLCCTSCFVAVVNWSCVHLLTY